MNKCYCSPLVECLSVETSIIAASAPAARQILRPDDEVATAEGSSWGSIWD